MYERGLFGLPPGPDREWEDGAYLGTCDWGYCGREQAGWARSESDASEEWVAICAPCAVGDFPDENDEPFVVDEFAPFPEVPDAR